MQVSKCRSSRCTRQKLCRTWARSGVLTSARASVNAIWQPPIIKLQPSATSKRRLLPRSQSERSLTCRRRRAQPSASRRTRSSDRRLRANTPFGVSGSLGVLDYRQNARGDEACRAHHAATAVQLADLDRRARAADLDAAPGTGGFDDVFPGSAVAGVDQDLDKISFGHYASISTQFGRYLN